MDSYINTVFRPVERVVGVIDRTIRGGWQRLADGPLQDLLFILILVVSGCITVIKGTLSEADRFWANIEKALIGVAMLAMTALSFMDYMRREISFFDNVW